MYNTRWDEYSNNIVIPATEVSTKLSVKETVGLTWNSSDILYAILDHK